MAAPSTPSTTSPLGQGVTGLTLDMLAERIEHEREMRGTREEAAREALELQAHENAQHFSALNGEQARIALVLATTIPREVFDNYKADREKADKIVAAQLSEEKGARAQTTRWMTIALFAIAVLTFLLKFVPTQAIGQ